jgi:hypothetical protein
MAEAKKNPLDILSAAALVLEGALDRHRARLADLQAARRAKTEALNDLNKAQHAFDEATEAVRDSATDGSDWKRRKMHREAV